MTAYSTPFFFPRLAFLHAEEGWVGPVGLEFQPRQNASKTILVFHKRKLVVDSGDGYVEVLKEIRDNFMF